MGQKLDRQWTGQRRTVSMNLEAKWEGSPGAGEAGEHPWRWGSCAAVLGESRLEEHPTNKEGAQLGPGRTGLWGS